MEKQRAAFPELKWALAIVVALAFAIGTYFYIGPTSADDRKLAATGFTLTSPAFVDGGTLPVEFTGDGDAASPPLEWSNAPAGTKSFAVTMHHIPGPGDKHVYLVIYNIPADVHSLAKNAKDVGTFGINTVNQKQEYTPPHSKGPGPKKYTLTVYALSAPPKIDQAANAVTMDVLLNAIKDTTLAKAEMNVTYTRPEAAMDGQMDPGPGGLGGPGGPPDQGDGPPRGGPEQQAIDQLQLTDEQRAKIEPILNDFRDKQNKLREDFFAKLKGVLDDKQFQQFEGAFRQPPPPPPGQMDPGGNNNPPPPPN